MSGRNAVAISAIEVGNSVFDGFEAGYQDLDEALLYYTWPGNLRELRNIMEYASICANGSEIELADLPQDFVERVQKRSATAASSEHNGEEEKDMLVNLLQKHGNNRSAVARELGIDRVTLWRRMTRLGLSNVSEV